MPAKKTTEADDSSAEVDESTLAWGTTAFELGADVGLVARRTIGLIEQDNPSTRERLWGLVSSDASLDDILDELSSTGLKALPDFGLVQVEGNAVRVVARGRTTISAELSSGSTHEIDPSDVRTWIEEVVEDVAAVTISLPPLDGEVAASTESFAVLAGSVPAASLTRRYDAPDDHAGHAESGAGWTAGRTDADSDEDVSPEPASEAAPDEAELSPAPEVELEMVVDIDEPELVAVEADDADADESAGDSWFGEGAGEASAVIPPQPIVEGDDAPADPQPAPPIDITADPIPADPQPADPMPADPIPADPQPADPMPADPQPPAPGAGPSGPPPSGPGAGGAPPSEPAGLITGGPGTDATVVVGPDDGPTRGPVSSIFDDDVAGMTGASPGDHDGMTVGRSELDDLQAGGGDTAMSPNDAHVYGVLSFSNGERIDIDRSILIGRNPKVAGAVEGGLPHIMKFDGPGQGLSRTHAEVRVEGTDIVLEDLQSTNGTEMQLPGQQRRRLRGGEPVVIVPGTLIDFGDELHCTLESAS